MPDLFGITYIKWMLSLLPVLQDAEINSASL